MEKANIECIENTILDSLYYGKFVAEPLERGYGITLGNSLRRVLLSDLQGSAITAIKIEGVPHEFSVIEGVLEDAIELILNIKGVVLVSHSDEPKIVRISAHNKGPVIADDIIIDADLEIINPDWHIATLEEGAHLEIEMRVENGKGFVVADKSKTEDLSIGWIPVDAIYMPVRKVAYHIEDTRVGQTTDHDRLILEIWTNGSIEPKKALSMSAQIIREKLTLFTGLDEEIVTAEEKEEVVGTATPRIEDITIEELEFSVRSFNCLKRANIYCLGDLLKRTERELMEIKNFGRKSAEEVIERMKQLGYALKPGRVKDE